MTTALQLQTDTMADWKLLCEQAAILIKTGFLPKSITTAEQAVAIVLTGRELGIGMMAALNNINVIQGKPTVNPQMMLALINRSGQLEDMAIETGKDGATCTIKRRGRTPYTARFGPAEARAMGLDGKDNYKKQPATMYQWRAVAAAARVTFPDVLNGLYTPEEMGADTDAETGEIIEATPEPQEFKSETLVHEAIRDVFIPPADEPESIPISKPRGGYHETLPERTVKLEGVQPTDKPYLTSAAIESLGPKTQDILRCLIDMKWDANDLANYIFHQFKVSVDEGDAVKAINALDSGQKKALHQMIMAECESRGR